MSKGIFQRMLMFLFTCISIKSQNRVKSATLRLKKFRSLLSRKTKPTICKFKIYSTQIKIKHHLLINRMFSSFFFVFMVPNLIP
jgi:hypothetical protein